VSGKVTIGERKVRSAFTVLMLGSYPQVLPFERQSRALIGTGA